MTDSDLYIQRLLDGEAIRKPLFRSILKDLNLPVGSHGLDVGCGIGLQCLLLAEAVGRSGQITGLDIVPEFLANAKDLVRDAGLANQITFHEGDFHHLPFNDHSYDWVWSADCVGYPIAADLKSILRELIRVTKPGGEIFMLAWTSQQILPGYPMLEAKLNSECSSYGPYYEKAKPDQNYLRSGHWFIEVGLKDVTIKTYTGDVQALLSKGQQKALLSLFEMLWEVPGTCPLSVEYQNLCNPASSEFILDIPDYYAFFTYSVFRGRIPANDPENT